MVNFKLGDDPSGMRHIIMNLESCSSVVRAANWYLEGHGFNNSIGDSDFFLVPHS